MPDAEQHTWVIDSIEEDVAAIEEDGERLRRVALWMLPPGVREGTTLIVTRRSGSDGDLRLHVTIDRDAAPAGRDEERKRPRSASDPGGDIVL